MKIALLGALLAVFSQCLFFKKAIRPTVDRRLVWADEFEKDGHPDPQKWSYDLGTGCPDVCGWGNNELQFYTSKRLENARVENGFLTIEARKEAFEKSRFTSARLASKKKGDWTSGRIEARIKCPIGKGTWPAFWMLPTDWKYGGWPRSGEIDIMEHVGYSPDSIFGTTHTEAFNHIKKTQSSGGFLLKNGGAESDFHVYAVEWRADRIDFFIDDQKYHTFKKVGKTVDEWPFDQDFHVILNLAVGGNWGARNGFDESIWPQKMLVDWVRVYE